MKPGIPYRTGEAFKRYDIVRHGSEIYRVLHYGVNGLLVENGDGGHGGENPDDFDLIERCRTLDEARAACHRLRQRGAEDRI